MHACTYDVSVVEACRQTTNDAGTKQSEVDSGAPARPASGTIVALKRDGCGWNANKYVFGLEASRRLR